MFDSFFSSSGWSENLCPAFPHSTKFSNLELWRPGSRTGQVLVHRRLMSPGFGLIFNVRKEQREAAVQQPPGKLASQACY